MKTIEDYQEHINREIEILLSLMDLSFSSIDSIKNMAKKERRELTENESKAIEAFEKLICIADSEIIHFDS